MKKLYKLLLLFLLIFLLVPFTVSAKISLVSLQDQDTIPFSPYFKIPPKPEVQTSVYDYGKVLSETEKKALEEKLLNYADSTSTQIVVVTVPSLFGSSIEEVTPKWAHEWGIGQADKDNGTLILLSHLDNEIWIAPGYGLDDRLTAGRLGHMIRAEMIPEFKVGKDYKALDKGTDALFLMLEGKYKADEAEKVERPLWGFFILEAIIFFLCFIYHALGGFWAIATGVAMFGAAAILSSSGKSSRRGFRRGFGGGGFSGGGAGGKW